MRGKCVVASGLDLSGKGTYLDAMVAHAKDSGVRVFDIHRFWAKKGHHPTPAQVLSEEPDILYCSEPTYVGIGRVVRDELISRSAREEGRTYTGEQIAGGYALDRQIFIANVESPLRDEGVHILKSRCFLDSWVYQGIQAENEESEFKASDILELPGNKLAALPENFPTHLLIMAPPAEVIRERMDRVKQDDAIFEEFAFQSGVRDSFLDPVFTNYSAENGARLLFPEMNVSVEYTEQQARNHFDEIFGGE